MRQAEQPSVQSLPPKTGNFMTNLASARTAAKTPPAGPCSVERVADQRMADMRQMHADLMGAPGQQATFDQRRGIGKPALDAISRHRGLAALPAYHRHLLAVDRAAA